MPAVFLSHSHKDRDICLRIARDLRRRRFRVWIDEGEIHAGDSLVEKISQAIEEADFVVVALSNSSVRSAWVRKELAAGLIRELESRQVIVLPVRLDECPIPLFLRDKKWLDLSEDYGQGIGALVSSIRTKSSSSEGLPSIVQVRSRVEGYVLYEARFRDWKEKRGPTDTTWTYYHRGSHVVHVRQEAKYDASFARASFSKSIAVTVEARKISGSNKGGYGLVLTSPGIQTGRRVMQHVFMIAGNGNFSYQVWANERPLRHGRKVKNWEYAKGIQRGRATNRLTAVLDERRVSIYVNSVLTYSGDLKLPSRDVAVGMVTLVSRDEGPDLKVAYRDLRVVSLG